MDDLDRKMIAEAKRRAIVRLDDGMLYTLLSWGCREGRNRIRCECPNGDTFTTIKTRLTEVVG